MTTYSVSADNTNYCAEVITVRHLTVLEGLDNLRGLPISGYQALVPKDTPIGSLMVVFPAESRLAGEFLSANNLFRHSDRNFDQTKVGYVEDNGRVKAIRLRGHTSNALALELTSLREFVGSRDPLLKDTFTPPESGTLFDTIDGVQIVKKYEIPRRGGLTTGKQQAKIWRRVDDKFLPEHIDSENWWRNEWKIADDQFLVLSQKLHGTSVRIANTYVKRQLKWYERALKRLGVNVSDMEMDHVYGSRKVIKDPRNPAQQHWYKDADGQGYDIWTDVGQRFDDLIPPGVIVYAEIIGWTKHGAPIQKGYTYDLPVGESEVYVYRVAVVTPDGHLYDLSWRGVEEFCAERGMKTVPVLWTGLKRDLDIDSWMDRRYRDEGFQQAVQLSDAKTVDEGVVARVDGLLPLALKAKAARFFEHETKMLDAGEVDLETEGSADA